MRSRRAWSLGLAVVLVAVAALLWLGPGRRGPSSILISEKPGASYAGPTHDAVFLILVDTLRADRLSCYGYAQHETPHVDRLAESGVRFDRAQSVAAWTRPSVASIFTSLYPTQLGLVERPGSAGKRWQWRERREQVSHTLPEDETTLTEILQDAGFTTGAFVNQPALNHQRGYQQGFQQWIYPHSAEGVAVLDTTSKFTAQSWMSTRYADRADALLIDAFDAWLDARAQDEKVFVYLHLLTPHLPYLPKPPFAPQIEGREPTDSELYDGEVRMVDAMLGRILEIIEARCEKRNTLVVFTSDHGEELEDHGMMEHGHSLHREVIRVPLILRSPHLPTGPVVDAPVRTIDLMPTILELVGLGARDLMGRSLHPLIAGTGMDLPVYSEAMLYGSTETSLIEDGYKLMYDEQETSWRLFDLSKDPLETEDLADEQPARLETMRIRLQTAHRELSEDYVERLGRYQHDLGLEERAREEERARQALEALGYIDID
jgi:arylsulfatase A-like enzyme